MGKESLTRISLIGSVKNPIADLHCNGLCWNPKHSKVECLRSNPLVQLPFVVFVAAITSDFLPLQRHHHRSKMLSKKCLKLLRLVMNTMNNLWVTKQNRRKFWSHYSDEYCFPQLIFFLSIDSLFVCWFHPIILHNPHSVHKKYFIVVVSAPVSPSFCYWIVFEELDIMTMFTRYGSMLFRNEMKPFYWSIFGHF